ncbi:tetratricopeptide repeat protein [Alteromonas sp. KUL49]|uniref:tetratricopeptide repeat protein n=1 Tax=Alteromonas sp. KUL49 TaxID=2480798 RepID=UPI00102EEF6A|nr:tetratricopeptide repeat protein [Alteromonas sp. KUL49]TAP42530.1 tetratricopeptide repeat protein [Alteromonas sp. KUL49]GEA10159.1 hypothetical protein KUL49_05340 [Alteromonas sp. KUL49]
MNKGNTGLLRYIVAAVLLFCASVGAEVNENYELAVSAYSAQKYKDAYIHVKNALQQQSDYVPAHVLLAQLYLDNGLFEQANASFQQAYDLNADPSLIFSSWGQVLLRLRDYPRILELEYKSISNLDDKALWVSYRAQACEREQRWLCAKQEYQSILRFAPDHSLGLNGLALLALNEGSVDEAEALIAKSTEHLENNAKTWWLRGELEKAKGNITLAQQYYNKAYLISPDTAYIARSLIDAYVSSQDFDTAIVITEDLLSQAHDDLYVMFVNSWLTSQIASLAQIQPQLEAMSVRLANVTDEAFVLEPALYYLRGMVSLMQENFESAREDFAAFAAATERDLQTAILLATTNMALGDKQSAMLAIQDYEEDLAKVNLKHALMLGGLYLENKRNFKAVALLERLQNAYPDNIEVALFSVRVLLNRGLRGRAAETLNALLSAHADNRQVLIAHALFYLDSGVAEQAEAAINILLTLYPDDISVKNIQAAQLLIDKQYEKAEAVLNQVLAEAPTLFATQYNKATLLIYQMRYEEALVLLERLNGQRSDHPQVIYQLAKVNLVMGNVQGALTLYERLLARYDVSAQVTYAAVAAYVSTGNISRGIGLLRRLIAREPDNDKALVQLASLFIKAGDITSAKSSLLKLEINGLRSADTLMAESELWLALGELERAVDILEKAHRQLPDNVNIHLQWVKLLLASNDLVTAESTLSPLVANRPRDPYVLFKWAELAQSQQNIPLAYERYKQVLAVDDGFELALAKLYTLSTQLGDFSDFLPFVNALVERYPDRYFSRNLLAQYHYYFGSAAEAVFHYEILLKHNTSNNKYALLNRLATLYLSIDSRQSEVYAKQAHQLMPTNANVLHTYGWVLVTNKKFSEALPILREASVRDDINPSLKFHLAYTLHKLQRSEEALDLLQRALSSNSEFAQRVAAQQLVAEITNI